MALVLAADSLLLAGVLERSFARGGEVLPLLSGFADFRFLSRWPLLLPGLGLAPFCLSNVTVPFYLSIFYNSLIIA